MYSWRGAVGLILVGTVGMLAFGPRWWFFILTGFLILRWLWRGYCHPVQVLTRQAVNMNWLHSRYVRTSNGLRNQCFSRNGVEVMLLFAERKIYVIHPEEKKLFSDFIELERWLVIAPGLSRQTDKERLQRYIGETIELMMDTGIYLPLMRLQSEDWEFGDAVYATYRAGCSADIPAKGMAVTLANVANEYNREGRELALGMLGLIAEEFVREPEKFRFASPVSDVRRIASNTRSSKDASQ